MKINETKLESLRQEWLARKAERQELLKTAFDAEEAARARFLEYAEHGEDETAQPEADSAQADTVTTHSWYEPSEIAKPYSPDFGPPEDHAVAQVDR